MNYDNNINLLNLFPKKWQTIDSTNKSITLLEKINIILKKEIILCKENSYEIYPFNQTDIFKIFDLCDLKNIKVVILGQDPYYAHKSQANGIAFSVNDNVKIPPSLKNIFKELKNQNYSNGDLSSWVKQGVFLLNTSLTVKQKHPNSHSKMWQDFIQYIIELISTYSTNVIFVAWGSHAYNKLQYINTSKHTLLTSTHPSPLSCYKSNALNTIPFIGSNVFQKINNILIQNNKDPIIWF
jgi:uracil-DNA glycosylase